MNGQRNLSRAYAWVFIPASIVLLAISSTISVTAAPVDTNVAGLVYHAQVTSYYCASATVQMMLDNTAVRSTNPYVDWILTPANAPDPVPASFYNPGTGQDSTFRTIPFNAVNNIGQSIHPTIAPRVIPGVNGGNAVNAVTYGPQLAIYDLIHGAGTFTPVLGPNAGNALSYHNNFTPWGSGSGVNAQQFAANVFDNPNVGGEGNHGYTAYNIASRNTANRTIANAIKNYNVPAGGVFYGGQHAMAITGVQTDVAPVANQPYNILGFYVDDPWWGYAMNRWPLEPKKWGKKHTLYSTQAPVGGQSEWASRFTLSAGQPGEGLFASGVGFKFVVEPLGPEPLDDGSNNSELPPVPLLPNELDAAAALALANQILADNGLSSKYGLSNGAFDPSGMSLLDPSNESDWFIPYKRGSDYTGIFMIDSNYGILEQASWDDAGELATSLSDLLLTYEGITEGFHPDDNPTDAQVPEPGSWALMAIAAVLFVRRNRARVAG